MMHPKLAKDLLNNPDAMRDWASQLANAIEHKIHYSKLMEQGLLTIKQKTRVDKKLLPMNHLLFAQGSACCTVVSHSLEHDSGVAEGKDWGEMKQAW